MTADVTRGIDAIDKITEAVVEATSPHEWDYVTLWNVVSAIVDDHKARTGLVAALDDETLLAELVKRGRLKVTMTLDDAGVSR